eukprot:CAMPEP_0171312432 /NCGR_PEP_ID=MMETSP0816-20121228/22675_1 /TAXON_ID=420281 /ORGANISM="Proboscia inermis, Strain CCAP1064/1" /LENGTH=248 /DNA_ID=CAMNT_0011797791 /DNA_START=286 /DNA_END=1032 /DNA_ORIENTATION=+
MTSIYADDSHPIYYDGPTHIQHYTRPSRLWEQWYCTTLPGKELVPCTTYIPSLKSRFQLNAKVGVRADSIKTRTLYAVEDIKMGQFIASDDVTLQLKIDEMEGNQLDNFIKMYPDAQMYQQIRDLFEAYGFENEKLGSSGESVSLASNATFINHGCEKQTVNIAIIKALHDGEDDTDTPYHEGAVRFSPAITRRAEMSSTMAVATRDIKKGEEILEDYRFMVERPKDGSDFDNWMEDMCQTGVGDIVA